MITSSVELNCSSFESALRSMSRALGVDDDTLHARLRVFDIDLATGSHPHWSGYPGELVLHHLQSKFGGLRPFHATHWFHLTRTHDLNVFRDGILPLHDCVDQIWEFLYSLVDGDVTRADWDRARTRLNEGGGGQFADLYRRKLADRVHAGPYAMLVRESAFAPRAMGNHDYLGIPEIVEDICSSAARPRGTSLRQRYVSSTRPCIVQFKTPGARPRWVESSLYYLYSGARGLPMSLDANTCWDSEGHVIGASQIVSVEFTDLTR